MKKGFFTFSVFFVFCFCLPSSVSFAAKYEKNLSTYYPSPFGTYETLYLKPRPDSGIVPCKVGTIFFDDTGSFRVCQENTSGVGSWDNITLWEENGILPLVNKTGILV